MSQVDAQKTAVQQSEFECKLEAILKRELSDCSALISSERLSGGASQETYRLIIKDTNMASGQRVLALRRAAGGSENKTFGDEYPSLATEALLIQSAKAAGVPEPEIYYVLTREDGLGDGFIMEWLDGEALGARIVRSEKFASIRPKLAYECGRYMARIHKIDLHATGLDQYLPSLPPEKFIRQTWQRYQGFNTPQPMIDFSARWLLENLPKDVETKLVHSDFRNGNFMLAESGIVGVLDWELAHMGDPMRDLGWICTNSWRFGGKGEVGGFGEKTDLFRGYEEESGILVNPEHVKFWEVFGSFWWAVGCLGMAEQYRSGPDRTVERPAIGRRSSECQVDCVNLLIPGEVSLVKAAATISSLDMPRSDELLKSVLDFLRAEVMDVTQGRVKFLSRVAANSLDIVQRELALGEEQRRQEKLRLQNFYDCEADLENLRWRLVEELRHGEIALDNVHLHAHLRQTVVNQIAIDQPSYSGYKLAIRQPDKE